MKKNTFKVLFLSVGLLSVVSNLFAAQEYQVGVRPFYLINDMEDSKLKKELQACQNQTIKKSNFVIGHRGAAMQFPEHTKESYLAAAKMGAGIIECDVTFTKDKELVCRHSQCDLQNTTNILATPLAQKCSETFTPAQFDKDGKLIKEASAKCCTSDITLAEFKTLKGKMDSSNKEAKNVQEYINSTPSWRTDLYTQSGTLMTHKESIDLFKKLNVKMTPELKAPEVVMPFNGFSQEEFAQKMINEYKEKNVPAKNIFAQSFNIEDIKYWIKNEPEFGKQAVYLDSIAYEEENGLDKQITNMENFAKMGINYIAPPMFILVTLDKNKNIIPSKYAKVAAKNGLKIITWTFERSGLLKDGGGWYYTGINEVTNNDGDKYELLDVLAQDVKIKGIFSDWPASVTYYANCKGLD